MVNRMIDTFARQIQAANCRVGGAHPTGDNVYHLPDQYSFQKKVAGDLSQYQGFPATVLGVDV